MIPPKYRLLALDLDGTLTNREKQVSLKNREFIRRAQKRGTDIILASGRPVIGIEKIAQSLDLHHTGGYILAYNGGHILDCKTGKSLVKRLVPMEYTHDICEVIHQFHVFPLTYNETGVICENDEDIYVKREAYNNSIPVIKVPSLEQAIREPVVKFMVVGEPSELEKASNYLKKKFDGLLNVFFSEPYFLEITPPGIEKSSALKELTQILNIPRNELMACGDGLNDIPMMKFAGFSVAMENAYEETKKVADYIVPSNEEDGVAVAIEKFILNSVQDPLPNHQNVAVFGLGGSGLAAARLLSTFHKKIIASDNCEESRREELSAKLPPNTDLILGKNEIGQAEIIVTSPGLEPSLPIFETAKNKGIPVIAELDLAFRATRVPMVAITGTDGKTTTTTLTSHILNTCDIINHTGGNVGIPLSNVVLDHPDDDCYVVETSAFQLVFCPQFCPHVCIATNIAEDHSEYFKGDWNQYVSTKRRPLEKMGKDDVAILNASDPEIRTWSDHTQARVFWYGEKSDIPSNAQDYACIDGGDLIFVMEGIQRRVHFGDYHLRGRHNAMNMMGAVLASLAMGCPLDAALESIHSYALPAHRIQTVCTHRGIAFIDDSKATNPHAGIAALETLDEPTVLIVGGVDKGLHLTQWLETMRKNVRHLMVIGELGDRFCREADELGLPIPKHRCNSLEDAVKQGYALAQESECSCVLLSPGCSSYDMFKSYVQRGEVFKSASLAIRE